MKTLPIHQWLVLALLVVLNQFLMAPATQAANANPPGKMTFQGFLTDASTPPVPLGNASPVNKTVTFTIYDNGTEGNVKWAESQVVTIDKGHFSVLLGEGSSVSGQPHATDLSDVFIGSDASDRWMGITVDNTEITPRIQFFAAPYAQLAKAANSLTSGATTGAITAAGDVSVTGAVTANSLVATGAVTGGSLNVGGNASVTGAVNANSLVAAGAVTGGSLNVGGDASVTGALNVNSLVSTGAVTGGSLKVVGDAEFQRTDGTSLLIQTPASDARIISGAPSNRLLLNPGGGFVGIGTFNPSVPLDVRGAATHTFSYGYLNQGANVGVATAAGNFAIITDQRIAAAEFNAISDVRVKQVVGNSDALKDLDLIRSLQVTDYHMIDQVAHANGMQKGFIAQEVEKLIPEAVSRGNEIIPNIYMLASSFVHDKREKKLTVTLSETHGLSKGDKVRLISDKWREDLDVTEILSETEFLVGLSEETPTKVFVYGKRVSDFRTLNYDRIFTTGISAIQELARQNEAFEKRVIELEAREHQVAALEKRVEELEGIEREMAELKKLVSTLMEKKDRPDHLAGLISDQ